MQNRKQSSDEKKPYGVAHKDDPQAYQKAYQKAYRESHKEEIKSKRDAHKPVRAAKREENKEKIQAKAKIYREKNKDKITVQRQVYLERCRQEQKRKAVSEIIISGKKQKTDGLPLIEPPQNLNLNTTTVINPIFYRRKTSGLTMFELESLSPANQVIVNQQQVDNLPYENLTEFELGNVKATGLSFFAPVQTAGEMEDIFPELSEYYSNNPTNK